MESVQQMVLIFHLETRSHYFPLILTTRAEISRLSLGGHGREPPLPLPSIRNPGIVATDITDKFAEAVKSTCLHSRKNIVLV